MEMLEDRSVPSASPLGGAAIVGPAGDAFHSNALVGQMSPTSPTPSQANPAQVVQHDLDQVNQGVTGQLTYQQFQNQLGNINGTVIIGSWNGVGIGHVPASAQLAALPTTDALANGTVIIRDWNGDGIAQIPASAQEATSASVATSGAFADHKFLATGKQNDGWRQFWQGFAHDLNPGNW